MKNVECSRAAKVQRGRESLILGAPRHAAMHHEHNNSSLFIASVALACSPFLSDALAVHFLSMGKQNRRKKGSKKSHKERQQERRDRLNEIVDRDEDDEEYEPRRDEEEEVQVGERVWFVHGDETTRGVLKSLHETQGILGRSCKALPVHKEDREDMYESAPLSAVEKDVYEWTLRFKVGDRVVVSAAGRWLLATVLKLWPSNGTGGPHSCYECHADETMSALNNHVYVQSDTDDCIIAHPQSFRFSVGDEVIFASEEAAGLPSRKREERWIRGKITGVDITSRSDFYAVYECSYKDRNRVRACYILKDDDQHVASITASPRERLLEAITQNCSYTHLDYLVESSSLDVMAFRDLIVSKAIESASYDGLLWLQENAEVNLKLIRDAEGNGLLHQIAKTPHAERFFAAAASMFWKREFGDDEIDDELSINFYDYRSNEDERLFSQVNNHGRTFLHELIILGNTRALDLALSPKEGLAWRLFWWFRAPAFKSNEPLSSVHVVTRDKQGLNLKDTARLLGRFKMEKMIDEFEGCFLLYDLSCSLDAMCDKQGKNDFPDEATISKFGGETALSVARRLIRFYDHCERNGPRERMGRNSSIEFVVASLCRLGRLDALSWLLDADPSLLKTSEHVWGPQPSKDAFSQPTGVSEPFKEVLDLVGFASLGDIFYQSSYDDFGRNKYISMLRRYKNELDSTSYSSEDLSLVAFIERQKEGLSSDYEFKRMLKHKLRLLQDDDELQGRLKVLDYLVKDKSMSPPNALDVIRWRQCGVLRWLVENSFLDLQEKACKDPVMVRGGKNFMFTSGQKIPQTMTIATFLCLAAIEFDDLQSFQWLVEVQEVPLSSMSLYGLNVMHLCACLGRAEIALWLIQSQTTLAPLLEDACTRSTWSGYFAAHIAAERGFTFLAEVFLSFGCPTKSSVGKTVVDCAKRSKLASVRAWGDEMEKPMHLEKDVRNLLRLVSTEGCLLDDVKQHIIASRCMDFMTWRDCGYSNVDIPGPQGRTYFEILESCYRFNDPEFAVWLCRELSPPASLNALFSSPDVHEWNSFWCRTYCLEMDSSHLDVAALRKFSAENDDKVLCDCLNKSWVRDLICIEPSERHHVLGALLQRCQIGSSEADALNVFRGQLLRIDALSKVMEKTIWEIGRLFAQGAPGEVIAGAIELAMKLGSEVGLDEGRKIEAYFSDWEILSSDGKINLDGQVDCDYGEDHPLRGMVQGSGESLASLSRLYTVLAIEGHSELIKWTRSEGRSRWDEEKEIAVVRITAYLGHQDVVDIFLRRKAGEEFASSEADCYKAAILGAAEAGKICELVSYWDEYRKMDAPLDFITCDFEYVLPGYEGYEERKEIVATSLVGCISACLLDAGDRGSELTSTDCARAERLAVVKWLVSEGLAAAKSFVQVVSQILSDQYDLHSYERCLDLFNYLINELDVDLSQCHEEIGQISEAYLTRKVGMKSDQERLVALVVRWLEFASLLGFDMQSLKLEGMLGDETQQKLCDALVSIQAEQLRTWSQFDLVKDECSLAEIKQAVEGGDINLGLRYRGGFLLTHLAAAYDRLDVLQWLVEEKDMSLGASDSLGRSVLEVAQASNAVAVADWIALNTAGNVVAVFASSHFRRRRALREKLTLLQSITTIQSWQRGNAVRRAYLGRLISRLDEVQRFQEIWSGSISLVSTCQCSDDDWTWQAVKRQEHDIMLTEDIIDDDDMVAETTQKLEEATVRAMSEMSVAEDRVVGAPSAIEEGKGEEALLGHHRQPSTQLLAEPVHFARIKLTSDVVKWLRRGDNKYLDFFVRRMKQLAAGDRSRILAKRLTGSKTLIYETYLEQKSGYRILWTESEADGSLLIWYVAKHKSVSRLMGLIDDAENRSSRQLTSASILSELEDVDAQITEVEHPAAAKIMLDPLGDTPLKLYEVNTNEIEKMSDPTWKPRLYLTARERQVVETGGTVLLLGRSGTGKTCVIGNRMDYDRQRVREDSSFSQLFVARSQRLCDYVKEAVDGDRHGSMRFDTFPEVVSSLEKILPSIGDVDKLFLASQKMSFPRFKRDFYHSDSSDGLDALVVWTNIRSFIKGSIEALQNPARVLSEEDYLDLGKKRCRLSAEQRKAVYSTFVRYDKYMKELGLWDDCDRIMVLAQRLENARASDSPVYQEVRFNKLYVDEVQDYTQAEIAVFFYLCGPGDLFLAGDPAQSVVEGVEFRFEEIRSVGYHLFGEDRRHLIPDKPKTVHVNFRSHCGILNVAAAVLSCLLEAFPDSAKQLKEDRGLFQGPRPGVFHKVDASRLRELVSKRNGIVVLTHDRDASKWKRSLGDYPLVYGIREAKGLEFQEVILVDFFVGIPLPLQKLWRDLLLGRDVANISRRPEIEGHLKLLYTAATRCIQRLFFAETSSSVAGDAFVRWLTTTSTVRSNDDSGKRREALAVKNNVETVEKMVRTPDEWRSAGLDNAVMAESVHELSEAETWLDRALYCFEQVGDSALASRARTHRASIRFQLNLEQEGSGYIDIAQTEIDAALLTEQLLTERLFSEARDVCTAILPLLAARTQETLQSRLISPLPSLDS